MKYSFLSKCLILSLFISISTSISSDFKATASIPQINIDEFEDVTMTHILKNYGSFEVIGPSIDKLSEQALEALQESKQVLNLPLDSLEKVYHTDFHGFQNVNKETFEMVKRGEKQQVRNQIAFHYKPYLEPRLPEGIKELKACANYYTLATSFLSRLYDKIADCFINPNQRSILNEGAQTSVLTLRKYYPGNEGETGISPHTDFGLLTLVISDRDGLEVLEGKNVSEGRWLNAPYGNPTKPRFYINVGDWLFLQTGNEEFAAGIHRVLNVEEDRYALILFMNPPGLIKYYQQLKTLDGVEVKYSDFLKSYKHDFHSNLKSCCQQLLGL